MDAPSAGDGYIRYRRDAEMFGDGPVAELLLQLRSVMAAFDVLMRRYGELRDLYPSDLLALDLIGRRLDIPITMGELSEQLGLSTGALTGKIDRLEAHGLVQRVRGSGDRRRVHLAVTERAEDLTADFFGPYIQRMRAVLEQQGADDLAATRRVLSALHTLLDAVQRELGAPPAAPEFVGDAVGVEQPSDG